MLHLVQIFNCHSQAINRQTNEQTNRQERAIGSNVVGCQNVTTAFLSLSLSLSFSPLNLRTVLVSRFQSALYSLINTHCRHIALPLSLKHTPTPTHTHTHTHTRTQASNKCSLVYEHSKKLLSTLA